MPASATKKAHLSAALQFLFQKLERINTLEAAPLWANCNATRARAGRISIERLSKMDERVDLAGKIIMKNGEPVYNLRRVQDVPVIDDRGFAEWMLAHDFPQNTKLWLRRILGWETLEDAAQPQDPF
jgi:hypothetical protein